MPNRSRKSAFLLKACLAAITFAAIMTWCFWDPGYGKISGQTYKFATAFYGACLAKDDTRIGALERLLETNREKVNPIGEGERNWLQGIANLAKQGKWNKAAAKARRMMVDQIDEK